MQDLEALLPRHITCLQLNNVPYHLTDENLIAMMKAWPSIRSMTLSGPGARFGAPVLVAVAHLQSLQDFHVRTDSSHVTSTFPTALSTSENTRERVYSAPPQLKVAV